MPVPFTCPHCGQLLRVSKRKVGQPVQCVRCHGGVIVPPPMTSTTADTGEAETPPDDYPTNEDLADPPRAPWNSPITVSRSVLYSMGGLIVTVAVVAFALGWAMGRDTSVRTTMNQANTAQYLRGRVTYLSGRGRAFSDSESVILAIPVGRKPDEKFRIDILRPEMPPPNLQDPTVQGIRSLGGDFARTDANGVYELELPATGPYYVLILSNHAQRSVEQPPTTTEIVEMGAYFRRAAELLGRNDYLWSKQIIRTAKTLDHQFGSSL